MNKEQAGKYTLDNQRAIISSEINQAIKFGKTYCLVHFKPLTEIKDKLEEDLYTISESVNKLNMINSNQIITKIEWYENI